MFIFLIKYSTFSLNSNSNLNRLQNGNQINKNPKLNTINSRQLTSPLPTMTMPTTTSAIINQNEYHVIELAKHHAQGFGFSIRGGKEFNIPLFVLKIAENGPAYLDGRLRVGDQILEINGHDAYQMTHGEAIERIKSSSGTNLVTLLIRRTGLPPPSITDIIAANASAAVLSAQQQQSHQHQSQMVNSISNSNLHQQQLRSKSPYLNLNQQQQYKNSSGTLINRQF